ncbi:MAG: DUF4124 domain-containing protein [Bdellovibrionota bacterium]|nr:MAG: DUF4124 domain-containing protein [Bdellovibrionota bacterium]
MLISRLLSFSLFFLCIAPISGNAQIYKWVDKDGVTHYSTAKSAPNAQRAELPDIMRAEVKLPKVTSTTCAKHGGANCAAGPDGDGSVICYDGFRDASPRFSFVCSAPKLEISDVSEVLGDGSFSVFVRNSKPIEATKPALVYQPAGGSAVMLQGPDKIDGFGVGEFVAPPQTLSTQTARPTTAQLVLSCLNCPQ